MTAENANGTTNNQIDHKIDRKSYLNYGEHDQMEIIGYKSDRFRNYLTWTAYFVTLGILRLVFHWYPVWKLLSTHQQCCLKQAEKVLIIDRYKGKYKSYFVKEVLTLTVKNERSLQKYDSIISINGLIFADDKKLLTFNLCDGTRKSVEEVRMIRCKKLTYIWDDEQNCFLKLSGLDRGVMSTELHQYQGYSRVQQNLKRITYGTNEIVVPVQSILTLLVLEALTPFYMFQLFSLIVWFAEVYYYYAVAIIIMSIVGITMSIIQTRKNQRNLNGTIHITDKIIVNRGDGTFEEVPTTDLVPGDIICIPSHGCEMQCDAVLLNGSCIVNESMLTGESVPVAKTALPNNNKQYDVKEDGNHTLFSGTKVIQTRYYGDQTVQAIVIRTGFLTAKGELVRSILYPPPADFKFDRDSYKFITILAVIAVISCTYTILSKYSRSISISDIIIKALDVITISIPPALPAAMTVGKLYALNRLKKYQIFCINSRVINVSGSIDCVCFDKTGTLTEDGLDLWGVLPVQHHEVLPAIKNVQNDLDCSSLLFQGMLTCHSLTLIDGEFCGDPLDVKMFESTNWVLEEPSIADSTKYDLLVPTLIRNKNIDTNSPQFGIIHQYQFSSTLQRMSVITRQLGTEYYRVFCKGAPETIMQLSKPETVPTNIFDKLYEYTEQGYRVIAMGTKVLQAVPYHKLQKLQRTDIEDGLEFVGLIILENRLKPETTDVIKTLKSANLKVVMITGDNILTAISVAKDCGIIEAGHDVVEVTMKSTSKLEVPKLKYQLTTPKTKINGYNNNNNDIEMYPDGKYHLVLTGHVWGDLTRFHPQLIPKILTKCVVFARMSGRQKQQVIEEMQSLGYYVAMCGDGANDCGALKAAHVGVSLSEAEASVASPFTSKQTNISCTVKIIEEGRSALVTSFGVFKLMLCYSLTELISVLILYHIDANLTSFQFLFIDICLILNFAWFFGNTKAYRILNKQPPMTSLLSIVPLTSIIVFILITIAFQMGAFMLIQQFDWFVPFQYDPQQPTFYISYENYAVYSVSMFQYIIMAVIFTKGKPYRQPLYTNYFYLLSIIIMTIICVYITLYPYSGIRDLFELKVPPEMNGRYMIIILAIINLFICCFIEDILIDCLLKRYYDRKLYQKNKQFIQIENEIKLQPLWRKQSIAQKCDIINEFEITKL